jgi:hypothetical protein
MSTKKWGSTIWKKDYLIILIRCGASSPPSNPILSLFSFLFSYSYLYYLYLWYSYLRCWWCLLCSGWLTATRGKPLKMKRLEKLILRQNSFIIESSFSSSPLSRGSSLSISFSSVNPWSWDLLREGRNYQMRFPNQPRKPFFLIYNGLFGLSFLV